MKLSILVASIIIAIIVKFLVPTGSEVVCHDYQLLGQTFQKCLTDRRVDE